MQFTEDQENIIIAAQEVILNSGMTFSVNGPDSFVRYEISGTDGKLAGEYWRAVCMRKEFSNPIIAENQAKLNALHTFEMPEWGYKGT